MNAFKGVVGGRERLFGGGVRGGRGSRLKGGCGRWAGWAVLGLMPAVAAAEIDSIYVGPSGGSWSSAGNWSPATAFPNNAGGDTYNASFPNNLSVSLSENIIIQQLGVSSGLILSGAFALDLQNGFSFAGSNAKSFSATTVNLNSGTGVWSGTGTITLGSGAVLNNYGILEAQSDSSVSTGGGGGGTFHNRSGATFRKSAGVGATSFASSITFINDGTIDIDSGRLDLNAGGTFNSGTQFTGVGVTRALSGTFGLNGNLSASDNFELAGGTVNGTHTLSGGIWRWTAGSMGGLAADETTLPSGASLTLSGATSKTLSARTVTVESGGVFSLGGANLLLAGGAVVDNSGTFEFRDDADVGNGGGGGTLNNLAGGILRKSGGAGTSSLNASVAFINSGQIDIDSGTFDLNAGGTLNDGTEFTGTGLTRAVTGTFALNGTVTADDNFEVAGSTVTGTHTLSGGLWRWTGGTWAGTAVDSTTIPAGVTLSATGSSAKTFSARTVSVATGGAIEVSGASLFMASNAVINNSGVLEFKDDSDVANGGLGGTINNLAGGIVRKSGGAGTTSINSAMTFVNDGTIDIDSGTFDLNGGATLNSGTAFSGTGLTRAVVGTFTFNGTLTADDNFEVAGGSVGGTHTLEGGVWRWTGGTWGGTAVDTTTIASGVTLGASGVNSKTLSTRTMTVASGGAVSWSGGNLQMANGGILDNGGTFDFLDDADVINGGLGGTLHNLAGGILRKSGGAGVTALGSSIAFINDGAIDVDSGTLQLGGGASLNHGTQFTGVGLTRAVAGTFALNGTLTADNNVELAGGTFTGTHTLSGGKWLWTGGTLGGSVGQSTTIALGASLEASGVASKSLSARALQIASGGTFEVSGGQVLLGAAAEVRNSGVFDVLDDADLVNGGGGGTFGNLGGGVFRKSGGAGTTTVGAAVLFNNSGVVEAGAGTLAFGLNTFADNGGTLRVKDGATISFVSSPTLTGGRVEGVGAITATTITGNGLTIAPGLSAGVLTLNGALSLDAASRLSFELGGLTPGNGTGFHDQLVVTGGAAVGGTLELRFLNGFQNSLNGTEIFTLLDAGLPITGSFANAFNGVRLTTADGLGSFLVYYGVGPNSDRLMLTDFELIPEPAQGGALCAAGLALWCARRRRG